MTHIGLFEGIGGFSEAIQQMGWETIAWCECNGFGQMILPDLYPYAKQHGDITKTDFTIYRGKCDILTGGFPCQPYSLAGKRKGKDDDRHLWPEMLRAIREVQPRWVVGENVFGLINWNGGMVFDEVQSDLEAEGYEVWPYVLPACAVNAPHRRDRVWFVAYSDRKQRRQKIGRQPKKCGQKWESIWSNSNTISESKSTSNAHYNGLHGYENGQGDIKGNDGNKTREDAVKQSARCGSEAAGEHFAINVPKTLGATKGGNNKRVLGEGGGYGQGDWVQSNNSVTSNTDSGRQPRKEYRQKKSGQLTEKSFSNYWQNFPTQSPVCDGNDGFQTDALRQRIREDSMGYLSEKEIDKILSAVHSQWRKETIKAGGNAIVQQVFLQICKAIQQYENLTHDHS